MKSLFEQMGGTYTLQGDYYLPNVTLPAEGNKTIGIWGQRHLRYIRQHRKPANKSQVLLKQDGIYFHQDILCTTK